MVAKPKKVRSSGKAKAADAPVQVEARLVSMKAAGRSVARKLHYEPIADESEQGYRIVSVAEIKKFAVTYWFEGRLETRITEAISADEAAIVLDKEMELRSEPNGRTQ